MSQTLAQLFITSVQTILLSFSPTTCAHTHTHTHTHTQVPTFQISVEDCTTSDEELLETGSNRGGSGMESGSNLGSSRMETRSNLGGGESGTHGSRPHSVLSMLRRPLSTISRPFSVLSSRAKSALSNRSTGVFTLPTNVRVRALIQKFVDKARNTRRKDVDTESIDSLSTLADPDRSVRSHSIKKKLDSLAGSEYGDYDEDRKKRWRVRCPQVSYQWKPTCNYFIDPHGEMTDLLVGVWKLFSAVGEGGEREWREEAGGGKEGEE